MSQKDSMELGSSIEHALPEGLGINVHAASRKIQAIFETSFFLKKGVKEIGDVFDLLNEYQQYELSADFPLESIPKCPIEELTRGKGIWCTSGSIRKIGADWRLNLKFFISRREIKPRFIDIRICAGESAPVHDAKWLHRVRVDKHGSLLSVYDLESLDPSYGENHTTTPILMHLRDISKPGEILDMDAVQAEAEGHASCVFINKKFNSITKKPDLTPGHAGVIKIELNEEIVTPDYAEYFINENLKSFLGTSTEFITSEDVSGMPVVVPSIHVQRVVCSYVENLEKYKKATRERANKFSEIQPLRVNPSKLLGHSLSLLEQSSLQSAEDANSLPAPISQVLSALRTSNKERRFLCSQYLIEVIIQFHVVTACAFAVKIIGSNKLEDAYKSFQSTKWRVTLATWKDIFDGLVSEFESCVKSKNDAGITSATSTFGEESFFAFSDLYSKNLSKIFESLIEIRNSNYGHPSFPPVETMDSCSDMVLEEANKYFEQTRTLWKWLAPGICREVPTNESCELVASIEEFSGNIRNTPNLSMVVPPGLLARNALVFYPRTNPTPENTVQSIPVTFIERISATVHGLYFFSRVVDEKLVFQSYSELKESTKEFTLDDPRIALLAKRIAPNLRPLDVIKPPSASATN